MRIELHVLFIVTGIWLASANAAVYRCQVDGKLQFSDKPCEVGAQPLDLPPVNVLQRDPEDGALADAYDERGGSGRKAQDKANAEWHKSYRSRKQREAAVRQGQLRREVVKGMTPAQVRNLMGEPDSRTQRDNGEAWTYRDGKSAATVQFRDGEVTAVTGKKKKSSGGGTGGP